MALTERLQILVTADAKGAAREFDKIGAAADKNLGKTEDRLTKLSAGLTSFGTQAVLAAGVAGAGLFKVAESASAYGEQVSRAAKTFGDEAVPQLEEFAKAAAETAGLSQTAATDAANTFAVFGRQLGLAGKDAVDFSTELVQLSGDFASFVDIDPAEAVRVFTSALSGEQEAIKRYGIDLSAAAVEQEALNMGLDKSSAELTNAEKVQARYNILLREGQLFAGDFADTSDSLANRQRALAAEFENAKVALGEGLLPLAEGAVGALQSVTDAFGDLSPSAQSTVGTIAGVGVALTGAAGVMSFAAGQAIKLRDRFTTLGADGSRSLNNLGKAARGVGAAFATWVITDAVFNAINEGAGYADEAANALNRLTIAINEGNDEDAFAAFADAVAAEQNTLRIQNLWQEFGAEVELVGTGVKADVEQVQRAFDSLSLEQAAAALDQLEIATNQLDPNSDQYRINTEFIQRNRAALDDASRAAEINADATGAAGDAAEDAGGQFGDMADDVDGAGDALRDAVSAFTDPIDAARDLDDALGDLGDAERDLAKLKAAGPDLDGVADALRGIDDAARDVADAYRSLEDAQRGVEDARIDLQRANEDLADELNDLKGITPGTVEYDEAQDRIKQLRRDQEDAVRGVEDAQRAEQDAARGIADAKRGQADAQQRLNDAQRDSAGFADELADAERRVRDARREVFDATIENEAAQLDFNQAMQDGEVDIDAVTGALFALAEDAPPEVQQSLADMANMMGLFAYVAASEAEKVKNAWSFQNLFGGGGSGSGYRSPSGRYGGYGRGAGQIGASFTSGFGGIGAGLTPDFADYLNAAGVEIPGVSGGRAAGGPVSADQTYMVNERGPELFSPKTSGFVMNAEDTNRLLAGLDQLVQQGGTSSGGTTVERGAITVVAPEPQEAASATVRKMRSASFLRGGDL